MQRIGGYERKQTILASCCRLVEGKVINSLRNYRAVDSILDLQDRGVARHIYRHQG